MLRIPALLRLTSLVFAIVFIICGAGIHASTAPADTSPKPGEPTDPKARKTFDGAIKYEHQRQPLVAMDEFRKANKQDGGHCTECLTRAYKLATESGDLKSAESILRDLLPLESTDTTRATVHFQLGSVLQRKGVVEKKDKCFTESCDEFKSALALDPSDAAAHFGLGISLAHLHQDEAARGEFKEFLASDRRSPEVHARAQRFAERVELARAAMAPPFSITTLDGKQIAMDSLAGKVVLIDFWATWCGPCREALPHIRKIAQKFEGQPLVVLSVSLDKDEATWKEFVAKNGMTWLQYRDGYFDGSMATRFAVKAIPATFSIDADGVLEDQHVGDADIEGKLKKLVAQAAELQKQKTIAAGMNRSAATTN